MTQKELQTKIKNYKIMYNSIIENNGETDDARLDTLKAEVDYTIDVKYLLEEITKYFEGKNAKVGIESYKISAEPYYYNDFSSETNQMLRTDGILLHVDGQSFPLFQVETIQKKGSGKLSINEISKSKVSLISALYCTNPDTEMLEKRRQFKMFPNLYNQIFKALKRTMIDLKTKELETGYSSLDSLEKQKSLIQRKIERDAHILEQMKKEESVIC